MSAFKDHQDALLMGMLNARLLEKSQIEEERRDATVPVLAVDEPQVMLAPNQSIDFDSPFIKYPVLGSAKFDGMRVKVMFDKGGSSLRSRTHKKLNYQCHQYFRQVLNRVQEQELVLDCELWSTRLEFSDIMSAASDPKPEHMLKLYMFDMMTKEEWYNGKERPFIDRVEEYQCWFKKNQDLESWLVPVDQGMIRNRHDMEALYENAVDVRKLEGIVVRSVMSRYKHGRCTLNEGLMFKWKKWVTIDARIVGFKQATQMSKEYESSDRGVDELGRTKRSHCADTRVKTEDIGSIEVETAEGVRFFANGGRELKPGYAERGLVWETREKFIGKWVEIKYQESGTKNKPRMPAIIRWRTDLDV